MIKKIAQKYENVQKGEDFKMFIYEMCPHCMNKLIERKQPMEDMESVNFCPECGRKLAMACFGEQKADNTVYKIVLNDASVSDYENRRNKFLSALMKMGGFNFREAIEKYTMKDSVIFEGDVSSIYINMAVLDGYTPDIHYTVVPRFPMERLIGPFYSICPTCGSDTIHKTVEIDNPPDCIEEGIFCEKCNEWVMHTVVPKEDDIEMLML